MENWYSKSKANYCSYKNEKYDKLYEELLMAEEGLEQTKHDKIYIAAPMDIDITMINQKLNELSELLETSTNEQRDKIKTVLKEVVPTFKEPGNVILNNK